MSEQEQVMPEYPRDLWDYLSDMSDLPERQSRDNLVQRATVEPGLERRVRIWDYFFRIDPEKVGLPLRRELLQLETAVVRDGKAVEEIVESCARKIGDLTEERQRVHDNWREKSERLESEEREGLSAKKFNLQKRLRIFSVSSVIGWIVILSSFVSKDFGSSCFGALLLGPIIITTTASLMFLHSLNSLESDVLRRVAQRRQQLHQEAYAQQASIDLELQSQNQRKDRIQSEWQAREGSLASRITFLRDHLRELLSQIPKPPTDDEVSAWLDEDVKRLREIALSDSGLRNRLARIKNADNPLVIRAPAKLQRKDVLLPPSYLDPEDVHFLYLQAERFTTLLNGDFVDFHGVYSFAFIIFGDDVLSMFRMIYDFISGIQIGQIGKDVHYMDVVSIESQKGYREIPRKGDKPILQPNVPSLLLSLPSGEIMEVSFPDATYFRENKVGGFRPDQWRSDPRTAADNAIRIVREKLDISKKSASEA